MSIKSISSQYSFFCLLSCFIPLAGAQDFYFDPNLLEGSGASLNLSKLNEPEVTVEPGIYRVDLYVNDKLIVADTEIAFGLKTEGSNNDIEPCLNIHDIQRIHLKSDTISLSKLKEKCIWYSDFVKYATWNFDLSSLKLSLIIPQNMLLREPRGFIPVREWDSGDTALFIKHNTNYYETKNSSSLSTRNLWSGISSGTNLGLWQLRNQSNLTYIESDVGRMHKWNNVSNYAQRPISDIGSILTVGDSYTNSSLFGSLSFNGIKLASDTRMLPQGKRGYAPEVRGVANTTARVIISQNGKKIYETIVSPGPFKIDDLYNTQGQGDLEILIIEANGQTSTFVVPYSAVPDSIRPGYWNYELALGRVRQYYSLDNNFLEGVLQQGLSNRLTGNAGVRLAKDYQAYLLGGVMATQLGAFGLNATYSHALAENNQAQSGWRAEGSYSKTFTTGTNLTLAAYRYSTKGFRDLQDVLGVRKYSDNTATYYSNTLNQKNQFNATVSHSFSGNGTLSLNTSTTDYYGNKSRITQLQFGYSNSYKRLSYNINIGRQRTNYSQKINYYDNTNNYNHQSFTENTVSIGFSIPFYWIDSRSNISLNMVKNNISESATTSVSGSYGEKNNSSYSVFTGIDKYEGTGNTHTWGGSLQQMTSNGVFRGSYSQGEGYKQFGVGTSGTLLIHRSGLTYGPYASETFALIEAEGAEGAEVKNGNGAKIDRFGYALVPSLSPYQYNTVSLDPRGLSSNVDIQGGSKQVVPYSGAIIKVKFDTLTGQQVLIDTRTHSGQTLPMGAIVMDKDGKNLGMVGQAGQIFARVSDRSGVLFVSWGNKKSEQCHVNYKLPSRVNNSIFHLTLPCDFKLEGTDK